LRLAELVALDYRWFGFVWFWTASGPKAKGGPNPPTGGRLRRKIGREFNQEKLSMGMNHASCGHPLMGDLSVGGAPWPRGA